MTTREELIDVLDRLVAPFEESGGAGRSQLAIADTPPARPPPTHAPGREQDVAVVVALSDAETRSGARKSVTFVVQEPCERCDGRGTRGLRTRSCRQCGGSGFAAAQRALQVRIPPDSKDGTELIVRGEGGRVARDGPRGDLLIRVEVT